MNVESCEGNSIWACKRSHVSLFEMADVPVPVPVPDPVSVEDSNVDTQIASMSQRHHFAGDRGNTSRCLPFSYNNTHTPGVTREHPPTAPSRTREAFARISTKPRNPRYLISDRLPGLPFKAAHVTHVHNDTWSRAPCLAPPNTTPGPDRSISDQIAGISHCSTQTATLNPTTPNPCSHRPPSPNPQARSRHRPSQPSKSSPPSRDCKIPGNPWNRT